MTKPLTVAAAGLLAVAAGMPLAAALLVTTVTGPAAAAQVRATRCADLAAGGAPIGGATRPTPTPTPTLAPTPAAGTGDGLEEGGLGFPVPGPGSPRQASLTTPAAAVPPRILDLYQRAADAYRIPWTLLAGIGMIETRHGAVSGAAAVSSAGAMGLMQFLPATFAAYGVDGDGDGVPVITSDADSVHTAAAYLLDSGVTAGPAGVRRALFAYNHATWYVNDVLAYAHAYGAGTVWGTRPTAAPAATGTPHCPR